MFNMYVKATSLIHTVNMSNVSYFHMRERASFVIYLLNTTSKKLLPKNIFNFDFKLNILFNKMKIIDFSYW